MKNRLQGGIDAEPVSANEAIKDSLLLLFCIHLAVLYFSIFFLLFGASLSFHDFYCLLERAGKCFTIESQPFL